ncbi:hypothetical protein [Streptomyces decoyicus]|uniref:hypothetical protein n=1 Tax=Streptomyces decoyicus TaxID=249567 RepID=UPI0033B2B5D8
MPEYQSAFDLLIDAELRADALGSGFGILVVEGPDDKRVFVRHVLNSAQVLPAGGRRILLSAHEKANAKQRKKMIFITDCDYEVRRGSLRGAPDLVITTLTDMESDLVSIGLLESIVLDLVPGALKSKDACGKAVDKLHELAVGIARPLGRIRMAAQPYGIPLAIDEIKIRKYWDVKTGEMDLGKLIIATHSKISEVLILEEWRRLVLATPDDRAMCHGKDLVRAISFVLREVFRVDAATPDTITRFLRIGMTDKHLSAWDLVRRVRKWQTENRRSILRS